MVLRFGAAIKGVEAGPAHVAGLLRERKNRLFDPARGNDLAFAGDEVIGRVILKLVTVRALEASHGGIAGQRGGAFTGDGLARQQGKALCADFAFNQPD